MNDHEAQRIAAAMHAARPDWPISSVLTLIRKNLLDRPRRDVFVALAWVASEPNSATPARVLESGPWWRAAGVDGAAPKREVLDPTERCGICSNPEDRCRAIWGNDHTFEADIKHKRNGEAVALIVESLKADVAPAPVVAESKSLDDLLPDQRDPNVATVRAALTTTPEEAA